MKGSEHDLQKAIIKVLRVRGHYAQRINCGTFRGLYSENIIRGADKGTPDILACIKGVFVGIEVKGGEKKALEWQRVASGNSKGKGKSYQHIREQKIEADKIMQSGGRHLIAYDLNTFIDWLDLF